MTQVPLPGTETPRGNPDDAVRWAITLVPDIPEDPGGWTRNQLEKAAQDLHTAARAFERAAELK